MPDVIIHTGVSIDSAITEFESDPPRHYQVAAAFTPDVMLVGSRTAKISIEHTL